jgi:dual specificity MAP kinase phosphatase
MPDGDPKLQETCQSTATDKIAMETGLTAQDEVTLEEKTQPTQAVTQSEVQTLVVENGNTEATVDEKRKEKKNRDPAPVVRVQKNKTMGRLKDEELDWIWIGDADDARDAGALRRHNVRYILNCTPLRSDGGVSNFHERDPYFSYCRTSMGDNATEHLSKRFEEAWEFLERVRVREDGGVLVHCQQGVSRSVSMTVSYLMKYYRKSFDEALGLCKNARAQANPNEGFMLQLKALENTLRTTNGYAKVPPKRKRASAGAVGATRGPAMAPARGPAVGPARGPAVGPARGPAMGPAAGPAVGPSIGPASGPAVGPCVGPGISTTAAGPKKGGNSGTTSIGPSRPAKIGPAKPGLDMDVPKTKKAKKNSSIDLTA